MKTYEDYLILAGKSGYEVREMPLIGSSGRNFGRRIVICQDMSETEKKCTLVEEMAHAKYTVGRITGCDPDNKQERLARLVAYQELIDLARLCKAFEHGCRNLFEMAEYLGVTEEFLKEAILEYQKKYEYKAVGEYIIYFHPALTILKHYKEESI